MRHGVQYTHIQVGLKWPSYTKVIWTSEDIDRESPELLLAKITTEELIILCEGLLMLQDGQTGPWFVKFTGFLGG